MHFERPAYAGGDVALILPRPALAARPRADHASRAKASTASTSSITARASPPAPRDRRSAAAADLPADFRHFRVSLERRRLRRRPHPRGRDRHAEPRAGPGDAAGRIAEALARGRRERRARHRDRARPPRDRPRRRRDRGDDRGLPCPDRGLPRLRRLHPRAAALVRAPLRAARSTPRSCARIDAAILGYRYWMDEPGNDVQWYFSENHALLFHTAAYLAGHLLPDAPLRPLRPHRRRAVRGRAATACAPGSTISSAGRWPSSTPPPISPSTSRA